MLSLKSIFPLWRHTALAGESAPTSLPGKPQDFGKASSFELLFNGLMGDPEAPRDTLFPPRNCR